MIATMFRSVFAAAVLFVLGIGSFQEATPARAATTYVVEIMGGTWIYMDCGWHERCASPFLSGVALDWRKNGNHSVYYRSFGYKGNGSGTTAVATIDNYNVSGQCKRIMVHLSSGGVYRGTAHYWHAQTPYEGNNFNVAGSPSYSWTQEFIGSTVTSENSGCGWTGEHLHQKAYWENVTSQARNTSVFPNYTNPGQYPIDVRGYHQDRANWSY